MGRHLAADANDNLRRTFETLAEELDAGDSRQFGPLLAVSAGVPVPLFNRVFVFERPPVDELAAAVDWMAQRAVPFWVTATDAVAEEVEDTLAGLDHEFVPGVEQPGMAIAPLDDLPPPDSAAEFAEVSSPTELDDFTGVAASVFEIPLEVERRLDRAALTSEDTHLFLGRVDEDPAASGLLARSGDVAGVYTIGVREEYRRRGLGEAMSRTVLRAGRDEGCEVGVLQSSEMAYPMYESMGFETVVTYQQFAPAP